MSRRRRSDDLPILADATVAQILSVPKPIDNKNWVVKLSPAHEPFSGNAKLDIPDALEGQPVRGDLHIYARQGFRDDDYSVGLIYTDYAGHSYPLIRCNGPHDHIHYNHTNNARFVDTPHVHRITEANQRNGRPHDNHAEPTNQFADIISALRHLSGLANFAPSGTLFLW